MVQSRGMRGLCVQTFMERSSKEGRSGWGKGCFMSDVLLGSSSQNGSDGAYQQ